MEDNRGWIKLYRDICNNWIYGLCPDGSNAEPFDKTHAWIDLLLMCNFAETKTLYKGSIQITKPGQVQISIAFLSKRWGWSAGKVRRYIKLLESDGMISQKSTSNGTTLTVEKWAFWQGSRQTDGTTDGTHNKKDKKDKKDKNIPPIPPKRGRGRDAEASEPELDEDDLLIAQLRKELSL